jgi:ribosomal protein S18 acetylase RimI-like enzyme
MDEKEKNHEIKNEVTIEFAGPEDAETICNIRDEAWIDAYPNPELGISAEQIELNARGPENRFLINRVRHLKQELAEPQSRDYPLFVAKQNGKVIGFVNPETDEKGHKTISQIYIDPKYQSKGLGSLLLRKAVNALGTDSDIYLEVVGYNQKAINFYEKFGFVKTNNPVEQDPHMPSYMVDLPAVQMVLKS